MKACVAWVAPEEFSGEGRNARDITDLLLTILCVCVCARASCVQIWKQNPGIVHPDYILFSGQALDIGRLYTVSASDNLHTLAKRFGTPLDMLYQVPCLPLSP